MNTWTNMKEIFMGYDVGEWFEKNLYPKLKEFIKAETIDSKEDDCEETESKLDEFVKILRASFFGSDKLKRILIEAIIEGSDGALELQESMEKCFDILTEWDEATLDSINYTKNNTKVIATYNQYDKD